MKFDKSLKSKTVKVINKAGKALAPTNGVVAQTLVRREKAIWIIENEVIQLIKTKDDWKAMKKRVEQEENRICYICNEMIPDHVPATIDHVFPKSKSLNGKYGTDDRENLRCCCKRCNDGKANLSISEFYDYVKANQEQFQHIDLEHLDHIRRKYIQN